MQEINELDIEDGAELIITAYEKQAEERAFQLYVTQYAWMDENNFETFDDFLNRSKHTENEESVEDILKEVAKIIDVNQGGWA